MEVMTVDFTSVLQTGLGLLAAALMAFGSWAVKRLGTRWGVQIDRERGQILDDAIHNAIKFAQGQVMRYALTRQIDQIQVRDATLQMALEYLIPRVPGIIDYFKLTPDNIKGMIEARLPGYDVHEILSAPEPVEEPETSANAPTTEVQPVTQPGSDLVPA